MLSQTQQLPAIRPNHKISPFSKSTNSTPCCHWPAPPIYAVVVVDAVVVVVVLVVVVVAVVVVVGIDPGVAGISFSSPSVRVRRKVSR